MNENVEGYFIQDIMLYNNHSKNNTNTISCSKLNFNKMYNI